MALSDICACMSYVPAELGDTDIDELKAMLGLNRSKEDMEVNLEQFRKIVDQTPAANSGGTETGSWLAQLHVDEIFIPLIDEYEYLPAHDDHASSQVASICIYTYICIYLHTSV